MLFVELSYFVVFSEEPLLQLVYFTYRSYCFGYWLPGFNLIATVELFVEMFLLLLPFSDVEHFAFVPLEGSFFESVMLEVSFLQGFGGRGQDVVATQPSQEVGVLVELVMFEELIKHDASRGQAVVRVVLEVRVTVLVSADLLSA
jgi:hypothetical protein